MPGTADPVLAFAPLEPPVVAPDGLPPADYIDPPDKAREPELWAQYAAMFGGSGLTYVKPALQVNDQTGTSSPPSAAPGPPRGVVLPHGSTRARVASRNWAGAAAPAVGGRRYSRIVAGWTAPEIGKPPAGKTELRLVSVWVGLGGTLPWANSMPQIGSEHGWHGGVPVHRLWCQWWLGGAKAGLLSQLVVNMPVQAGTQIMCSLTLRGDDVLFHWRAGTHIGGVRASSTRPPIANSANWMLERPTEVVTIDGVPTPRRPRPLPDIAEVRMTQCLARLGDSAHPQLARPFDGDLIQLASIAQRPSRLFTELLPRMPANPTAAELTVTRYAP